MDFPTGGELVKKLCDALGIDRMQAVTRIVIVADFHEPARAYIVRHMAKEYAENVCSTLAADRPEVIEVAMASVDEKGAVTVSPC